VTVDAASHCSRCSCANICVGKVFIIYRTLLQHNCSWSNPLPFTLALTWWPTTPLHIPASFPKCALILPKRLWNRYLRFCSFFLSILPQIRLLLA